MRQLVRILHRQGRGWSIPVRRFRLLLRMATAMMVFIVFVLPGCSRSSEPVDPVWGKEPCAHCAMIVSDKRFAAEVVFAEGQRRFFDDIGCMVLWLDDQALRKSQPERIWARDAQGQRWIEATNGALYFEGAKTPMDFGFEARASAAPGIPATLPSDGMGWNEMRAKVRQGAKRRNNVEVRDE